MTQLNLFDSKRADDRKQRNMKAVLDNENEKWKESAFLVIEEVARHLETFTSDDVRSVYQKGTKAPPKNQNSWGAIFNAAAKMGIIKKTGRYVKSSVVSSHGRLIAEWSKV